ncbi:hypothetical protein LOK49_LG05G00063 [Camellia lanceoleosa]|uniref:Uncharacterized protein n=1 Tax=Camellia lanceoleosa TaxID=1840588 RepID=A0ACC0HUC4_9ERIC|nr:hypothetical protein LOK49_LG05G00063 [Camellia lanceoleosa]
MNSRFENVIFVRSKESSEKQNPMQSGTGLVETIIVEVKDRERIGELKGTVIWGRTVEEPRRLFTWEDGPYDDFLWNCSFSLSCTWPNVVLRFVQFWKDIIQLHYHITAICEKHGPNFELYRKFYQFTFTVGFFCVLLSIEVGLAVRDENLSNVPHSPSFLINGSCWLQLYFNASDRNLLVSYGNLPGPIPGFLDTSALLSLGGDMCVFFGNAS